MGFNSGFKGLIPLDLQTHFLFSSKSFRKSVVFVPLTTLSCSLTAHELMYAAHEPRELPYLLHRGRLCCTELWASNETTDQRVNADTRDEIPVGRETCPEIQ